MQFLNAARQRLAVMSKDVKAPVPSQACIEKIELRLRICHQKRTMRCVCKRIGKGGGCHLNWLLHGGMHKAGAIGIHASSSINVLTR